MKKITALVLSVIMLFTLAACTNSKTDNESLAVCLASEPLTIDPALNSAADGSTMLAHLFSGIAKWSEDENGNLVIVADAAKELTDGTVNNDGSVTYTYTLKDGLKWSDGKAVKASDFVFAWNRAASPALAGDYHGMFDVIKGYDEMWESKDSGKTDKDGNSIPEYVNPEAKLAVKATDNKTLVVTLKNDVAYWNELLAFPTYYPVREDAVSDEGWATKPETYISNGPYKLTSWDHNSVITLTKNEDFYDAENITMPEIRFYLSDDTNNMLTNFKNGDWLLIDDVPTNEISSLKQAYPDEYVVTGQLGTYYICWNINENLLPEDNNLSITDREKAQEEIRKALGLLIDRNYIVEQISQGGQVPASSFVAMGLTNPDGTQFYQTAGDSDEYDGYYDVSEEAFESNYEKAIKILRKYYTFDEASGNFTNVPTLTYIYNTSDAHQAIGEYIQGAFSAVGIKVELSNQEWNTFLETRKNGDYSVARNGWLADYNDPISFLDMWTSDSGNNDIQLGRGAHKNVSAYSLDLTDYGIDYKVKNSTWEKTYDRLISEIKGCNNTQTRYELMHLAEDMLMDTGCITPIYYNTDIFMINKKVDGFFSNPLGYKYFMYTTINTAE